MFDRLSETQRHELERSCVSVTARVRRQGASTDVVGLLRQLLDVTHDVLDYSDEGVIHVLGNLKKF